MKENYGNLSKLLLSGDAANVELAMVMMDDGGVPKEIITELFLVYKNPKIPNEFRKKAHSFLSFNLPKEHHYCLLSKDKIVDNNINNKNLERNLKYIEDKGLNNKMIGEYIYNVNKRVTQFWFRNMTKEERAIKIPEILVNKQTMHATPISTTYLELEELLTFTNATHVAIESLKLKELPKALFKFKKLKQLSLKSNRLTSLPDEFTKFTELESLNLNVNQFAEFPSVLEQLPHLESITFEKSPFVKKEKIPESSVFEYFGRNGFERI